MPEIYDIIQELNEENGSNYKLSVLKKYQNNELLKRVLKMTYDRVQFTYGAKLKQIDKFEGVKNADLSLTEALDYIQDDICSRKITGHKALQVLSNILVSLSGEDSEVLRKIIDRDLKINLGKTQINKVWKGLITKPVYMRCGTFNDKSKKNVQFPAAIQLKADGTYREFNILNESVESRSRSGESYDYPLFNETLKDYTDGIYQGEITVILTNDLLDLIAPKLEKLDKKNGTNNLEEIKQAFKEHTEQNKEYILPRQVGNGLVNSDEVPHENLKLELWDYITHDEYENARNKVENKTPYAERFAKLKGILSESKNQMIRLIPHDVVNNIQEALQQVSEWMSQGYEGGVLKDFNMVFKDGTSNQQLKMKVSFSIEVRVKGYIEGKIGTKREKTFGSIIYETDDRKIRGSVSGFTDTQLEEINNNREKYLEQIMEIEGNDLTKARGNNYYAISHPRFSEFRSDKDYTDTLERALENINMSKCLV